MADKRIPAAAIRRVWLDQSLTVAEAAARVGLSRARLWVRANALGLPARKEGRPAIIPDAVVTRLWLAGVKADEIGAAWGCPGASVRQAARRLGLPRRCGQVTRTTGLTMAEYEARQLGAAMAAAARAEEAALAVSEMLDRRRGVVRPGAGRKAAA